MVCIDGQLTSQYGHCFYLYLSLCKNKVDMYLISGNWNDTRATDVSYYVIEWYQDETDESTPCDRAKHPTCTARGRFKAGIGPHGLMDLDDLVNRRHCCSEPAQVGAEAGSSNMFK
eukprot:6483305-Amphidinium_carterae.2